MNTPNAAAAVAEDLAAEQRWTEWVARGAAQNRTRKTRMTAVAVAIGGAFAVWFVMLLARG
ncbi:MAG TPA: hypothetical protein VNT81_02275 [Vicinamibacterales bacterium]|nr:hypothetical protein [Vicinamibacterales bacterium]